MRKKQISPVYLSTFCMELSMLLQAGIPIQEGISLLAEEESDQTIQTVLQAVETALFNGAAFHEALISTHAFPQYMLDVAALGETTGRLDTAMGALSRYFDRQETMRQSLRSAVAYPILLFFMMLMVIGLLITRVLPIFQSVFGQLGISMSPIAAALLRLGLFLRENGWIILGVLAGIALLCLLLWRLSRTHLLIRTAWNRAAPHSRLRVQIASARFAAAMAMHIESGLDPDQALERTGQLESNFAIRGRILSCQEKLNQGISFAQAVSESGLFSPLYCRMLAVGIRTGNGDRVMEEIARRSEADAYENIRRTIGKIEPALVFAMSLLVGLVLLSVLLPLADIMSALG